MDLGASPLLLSKEDRLELVHLASVPLEQSSTGSGSSQAGKVSRQWQQPLILYLHLKEENSKGAKLWG